MAKNLNELKSEIKYKFSRKRTPAKIKEKFHLPTRTVVRKKIWRQLKIMSGSLIAALGFSLFQVPYQLAAGGISGLGLILNHYTGFPIGVTVLLFNIPLIVIGFFKLNRWRFVRSTLLAAICFSFGIDFFSSSLPELSSVWPITDDLLLASIYAGVLFGLGMGIIQRADGTIGGTSIVARILHEYAGFPMSQSYLYTDILVIGTAGFVFNWEAALLAALTLVLSGIFSDFILEGPSKFRTATIVTEKQEDVRWAIIHKMGRGISLWPIEGGYSGKTHAMVFCTILRSRVADLKYTIATVDPDAFIVIGVAQQVIGGYGSPASSSSGISKYSG